MAPAIIAALAKQARSFYSDNVAHKLGQDVAARSLSAFDTSTGGSKLGPLAANAILRSRDIVRRSTDANSGVLHPGDINNPGIFVLFGLIGAGFVITIIWFFFWAKNGGFYFKKNDWEEYKSTVLRRKGPNGTILSNATPSTNLGGGSIYKDVDESTTTITDSTAMSGITAGVSDIAGRERRRKKREQKEREKEAKNTRRLEKKARARRHVGEDGVLIDEMAEQEAKDHLRSYKKEKAARVGGLNKETEGSAWDGSTNPTESNVSSGLLSNREGTPTSTPTKSGGIRKVYSAADRTADRETERIRAEARKLQEKGRTAGAGRRDFSFQRAESSRMLEEVESRVPGSWAESDIASQTGNELGTKSYRHHIQGLSSEGSEYAEEKREERKKRSRSKGGYRRGGGDEFTDVDI